MIADPDQSASRAPIDMNPGALLENTTSESELRTSAIASPGTVVESCPMTLSNISCLSPISPSSGVRNRKSGNSEKKK
jgi:hypothetical protein